MSKFYQKTYHIKANINLLKELVNENKDKFVCPFQNAESYLHVYKDDICRAQFFNLQECDYSKEKNREGTVYIKYLMSTMKKVNRQNDYTFLKDNFEKFCVETNEENFSIDVTGDPKVKQLLRELRETWCYDHSKPEIKICRVRLVRLPARSEMPFHRDETSSKNLRVICPIITNDKCVNAFKDTNGKTVEMYFPATGAFYKFHDEKIEHAVFNNSDEDRYALILTVAGVDDLKEWDRDYYRNEMFWKNWGHM
jgi:hypothetical protein